MLSRNLRHFRVFLAVADLGSPTQAAKRCHVTQPSVTQAIGKLEAAAGGTLFTRTAQGFFLSARGELFNARVSRAMARLDRALSQIAPRLASRATSAQLVSLVAVTEAGNVSLAARHLGIAQPTVHRAISQLEQEAQRPLFERTSVGLVPSVLCGELAQAARLAFAEFDQAETDLAEFDGREGGHINIGSLPLSRSVLLPEALTRFRAIRPRQGLTIYDGPYDEVLRAVRRGEMDFMIGALRDPLPIDDVTQEPLFLDHLTIVARPGHGLVGRSPISRNALARASWVVPRKGTPSRDQFDASFLEADLPPPHSILECGSILLMRELLARSDMLGCISGHQADAEVANGALIRLDTDFDWTGRAIGLTHRVDWVPTAGQALMMDLIRQAARDMDEKSVA